MTTFAIISVAMKALASILFVRSILRVVIALALLFAPLQFAGTMQASAAMAMSDVDCPQKLSCCDTDKAGCATAMTCVAKCGGVPGLVVFGMVARQAMAGDENFATASVQLTPHASSPLRRPPRA